MARRVGMVPDEAGTEARADANGDLGDFVGDRGCHCAVHQPGHGATGSSQLQRRLAIVCHYCKLFSERLQQSL